MHIFFFFTYSCVHVSGAIYDQMYTFKNIKLIMRPESAAVDFAVLSRSIKDLKQYLI